MLKSAGSSPLAEKDSIGWHGNTRGLFPVWELTVSWWKKKGKEAQKAEGPAPSSGAAREGGEVEDVRNTLRKGEDKPFESALLAAQNDPLSGGPRPVPADRIGPVQRVRPQFRGLRQQAVAARTVAQQSVAHQSVAQQPHAHTAVTNPSAVRETASHVADAVSSKVEPSAQEIQAEGHDAQKDIAQGADPSKPKAKVSAQGGIDWWLFVLLVMILGIGLVMVLSASGIVAENDYGDKYYFFKKQLAFAMAGGVLMGVAAMLPRGLLYKSHYPLLFIVLFMLLLTLSPLSPSINGAHRWIRVGPMSVQPMEFVKIALALYLAYYMATKQDLVKTFSRGVLPPFIVTVVFAMLLLLQPDFGSAVVLALLLLLMCIAGGTRFIYIFFAMILASGGIVALVLFEPYRMRRLMAFLDPFKDAHDTGYQLVQSLLAIGSGSFFGVGMGASRQKMFYLPEAHNDFIMAVLAEEMGFVGVSVVMLLFLFFFWRCYLIIRGQEELRARYTAFALSCIIALGVILNLAVVMGVAPPKGVPMPFLSYGGSNLVAMMICAGLLLNFSRTAKLPH